MSHWKGEFPLWKSYWLNSVIISNLAILAGAFLAGVFIGIFLGIIGIPNPGIAFWNFAGFIVSIPVMIWSFTGTWRSAVAYNAERPGKWFSWGTIAQICIGLGILRSVVYFIGLLV